MRQKIEAMLKELGKAIEHLEECNSLQLQNYGTRRFQIDYAILTLEKLTELLNSGEVNQWISVEERLPNKDEIVWAYGKDWSSPTICKMSDNDEFGIGEYCWRWIDDGCPIKDNNVTHWMPLPSAPSKGETE